MASGPAVERGQALGHYRVLEKIGAGGMGEVYRARDEHLDRTVAVKVLPPGALADQAARKRFRKEALALSRLNHPNIATVYDFDTQQDRDYLVMEYVGGEALRDKLSAGPLPESEIARLVAQVAEGLAAAHEEGVVHRDLKPEKLRITTEGRVKILDFGVAKLLGPVSAAMATETGGETRTLAGTLPYMAPEQLQGEAVDARTDIYTAGVVLYEMATGRLPFRDQLSTTLADAILHKGPIAPGRLNPEVSPRLEQIILKCLEKDPGDRYQRARDLLIDLRRLSNPATTALAGQRRPRWPLAWLGAGVVVLVALAVGLALLVGHWRAPAGNAPIHSLAVLPLANLSQDAEQEYFADGMTEALITDLAKVGALRVISRTSVLQYKGAKKPLPQIARGLNVDALIEGSVLRAGDQVRITAQLIAFNPERHLWAKSYDREFRNILGLHSEVAQAIADEIRVNVTAEERARLSAVHPVVPEAHEAYLRGRYQATRFTPEPLQKARQYLEEAVQRDPSYAPAWAELAHVYIKLSGSVPGTQSRELLSRARAAARRGLEAEPDSASAHMMNAVSSMFLDWDVTANMKEVRRAMELGPYNADVQIHAAIGFAITARKGEAIAAAQHALELEPLNYEISYLAGQVFVQSGEYDRGIAQLQKTLELDPNSPGVYQILARGYEWKGSYPESIAAWQKALTLTHADPLQVAALGRAFASQGMRGAYEWELARLKQLSPAGTSSPAQQASLYAALGQKEKAFTMLQAAYEQRDPSLFVLRVNRRFDSLRPDPRFQDILRSVFREE